MVALCLLGLSVSSADAKLPRLTEGVVLGTAIGGIKIGDSSVAVAAQWGKNGYAPCRGADDTSICVWSTPGRTDARGRTLVGESVTLELYDPTSPETSLPKVISIEIAAVTVDPRRSQLRLMKTSKGIGIGSTLKAARRAYPNARYDKDLGQLHLTPRTMLTVDTDTKRKLVTRVAVFAGGSIGPTVPCIPDNPWGLKCSS